jgi:hypothetical protein
LPAHSPLCAATLIVFDLSEYAEWRAEVDEEVMKIIKETPHRSLSLGEGG